MDDNIAEDVVPVVPWPITREDVALGVPGRSATRNALRRDATYRRALLLADVFAGYLAALAVVVLGAAGSARIGLVVALVGTVVVAKLIGLYDRDELVFHKSTLDEAPAVFQLATLFALGTWLAHDGLFAGEVDRDEVLLLWGGFFLSALLLRYAARHLARAIAPAERCLVVGKSTSRVRLAAKLAQAHARIEIVGSLPLADERVSDRRATPRGDEGDRRSTTLKIDDLDDVVTERDIHRVIIIPGAQDPDEMLDSIGRAKSMGVKISIVPRLFEVVGSSVEFDDLEGMTVLGVRRFGLSRSARLAKRTLDLAAATVLLVLLAPLFAVVALLVRADSRGPVFFRQTRVGLDGHHFGLVKFRSMVDGADAQREELRHLNESEGLFKIADDPRVTRVGRFLRRSSIDELPQLLNVLKGDMSLVGPRPLVVDEDSQVEGRHRGRLGLTPGITGPWQLLGPGRAPLNEMVTIDYLYGSSWSLWTDVKVLLRTALYVVKRRGM